MQTTLQDRLVEAGVDLVRREGVEALSLREIARRAGVSHGAPRRYFPTHQSLLGAIARVGYRDLGARIAAVVEGVAEPRARVHALSRAYVAFAQAERGMFELMFRHDLLRGNQIGLRQDSLHLFDTLVRLVEQALAPGRPPRVTATVLWANLQGIAQLHLWGSLQLAAGVEEIDGLLASAVDDHLGPAA